jgi:3-methyladenine DNA glycosylase AlkD
MNHPAADRKTARLKVAIKSTLTPLADPERAQQMSSYMRGKFEYLGIATPVRRAAALPVIRAFEPADALGLLDASRSLWSMPEREYQYAGLDLLDCHEKLLTTKELPALLKLVEDKSWWDTVDSLAGIIGRIVRREKQAGQRLMDRCVKARNLWVRRVAMLHQLGWRGETDTARLFGYAERLAPETDFFIRKAIGWALRDYAKHDRSAVENFIRKRKDQLSRLTCREALLLRGKREVSADT